MAEDDINRILNEHKKIHPHIQPRRRRHTGLIIATVVLALIAIILALALIGNMNPLDKIVKTYEKTYPDYLLSIQKVSADNAKILNPQIAKYCPNFKLDNYYFAQIDNSAAMKSFLFVINPVNGKTECTIDRSTQANSTGTQALSQNILATINGEPVYNDEVLAIYNNIPASSRTNTSLQDSLNQVIDNRLLMSDANSKKLVVGEDEVDNAINTFLTNNGLTLQQLEERLTAVGSSIAQFRNNTKNNLLLQKEISEVTKNATMPTDAEMQKYYDDNKQGFVTKASASIRQLLIYSNQTNDAEKLAQIKGIATMLNATNFCELVQTYSEDNASTARCGQYDFEQGQLLPEFEQVVFNSTAGTAKIIKTRLGYHIVEILNVTSPQEISFAQAKSSISNYLLLANKQTLLNQYVVSLRQNAKIVSYI